jgi:2-keto-3-deoxy-L-rhamnonate aldolase RhmA
VIVSLAKYPPIGNRGISGHGPHTGYKSYGARHATEYAPWANENIIICPSIESLEGLENIEKIAAVEGIDMIALNAQAPALEVWEQAMDPRQHDVCRHRADRDRLVSGARGVVTRQGRVPCAPYRRWPRGYARRWRRRHVAGTARHRLLRPT